MSKTIDILNEGLTNKYIKNDNNESRNKFLKENYFTAEALDSDNHRYFEREIYNALSDVIYDYKDKNLSQEDIKQVISEQVGKLLTKYKLK